jgi:hypothetical protein
MDVDISDLEHLVFDPQKSYFRIPTLGIKAEFLPQIKGLKNFKDAFKRSKQFKLADISIHVIGKKQIDKKI